MSLKGGVSLVSCLLSWLGRRIISIAPAQGRLIRECCGACVASSELCCVVVWVFGVAGWGPVVHFSGAVLCAH